MAQRYGGRHSPEGSQTTGHRAAPFAGKRRSQAGARVNLLFFVPLPLALRAFFAAPLGMAQYLGAFGLLMLAAWLTREGVLAQEAFEARKVARRPALPRKMLASALTGLGLGLAGLAGFGPIGAIVFLVLGTGLHLLSFGPDPLRDKGIDGIDSFQQDRVSRAVDEAEKHLAAMQAAIARTTDRALQARVESFQTTARAMFRTVEEDPRDLTAARKYLGVYLLGARDATAKFADLHTRTPSPEARRDYLALLDDLERNFAARTDAFLRDNKTDLDIEIDVLRDRLAREGIHEPLD